MNAPTSALRKVSILLCALLVPMGLAAQDHHHYMLVDIPTFGGPNFVSNFLGPQDSLLSQSGTLVGGADTSVIDPLCFGSPDCFVVHSFEFRDGVLTDLGTLPGGANSQAFWINARGLVVGLAQNAEIDPLLGIQELRAVVWEHGEIIDLGTFGGNESLSQAVNDAGQVVGIALNTIPDPISPSGLYVGTQMRAFLWEKGVMRDLGTLGGHGAWARYVNNDGQVAGVSFTDSVIIPVIAQPTTHAFLWQHGEMTDLGTLGGSFSEPEGLNNRGQVVGNSSLDGDIGCNGSTSMCDQHAFLWEKGSLLDLGTLGGSFALANGVNDSGEVVGAATDQNDQALRAFVWKKGVMTDLGALKGDDCSIAKAINARGQIVGTSYSCALGVVSENAALWEKGSAIDLNRFVPPGVDLHLAGDDMYINDRGEIAGTAVRSNGYVRAFLMIPCDENHPDIKGCDYSLVDAKAATAAQAATGTRDGTSSGAEQARGRLSSTRDLSPAREGTSVRELLLGRLGFGRFTGSAFQVTSDAAAISGSSLSLSPASLTFSTQAVGTGSAAETVALKNTGTTTLTISSIAITGTDPADFAQTHTCGSSLAAGASCNISVTFRPKASGTRTAVLSVTDNAAGSPQRVSLAGIGTSARLSPASLNFGTVVIGVTSREQTVTLTNVGTTTLTVTGMSITGTNPGDFAQTHKCASSLAAGASCNISVTFRPTASGTRTAVLSVTDNAAGSPQKVSLAGFGSTASHWLTGRCAAPNPFRPIGCAVGNPNPVVCPVGAPATPTTIGKCSDPVDASRGCTFPYGAGIVFGHCEVR